MDKLIALLNELEGAGYEFAMLVKPPKAEANVVCSKKMDLEVQMLLQEALQGILRSKFNSSIGFNIDNTRTCKLQLIVLQEQAVVERYFRSVFCAISQQRCKSIAKAWIKILEPKKKSKFPYIKGNASKPAWWPCEVVHREVDHLKKPERIELLAAILGKHLPSSNDTKLLMKLKQSTKSLPVLSDPIQHHALDDAYKVCWALCSGKEAVTALDLSYALPPKLESKATFRNKEVWDTNPSEKFTITQAFESSSRPSSATFSRSQSYYSDRSTSRSVQEQDTPLFEHFNQRSCNFQVSSQSFDAPGVFDLTDFNIDDSGSYL